jgi:transcriptional regulator with XRE-family HTH domain
MDQASHNAKLPQPGRLHALAKDVCTPALQNAWVVNDLSDERRNYLKAWREFRGLTQEQLAEKIDTTGGVVSMLESGDRKLSPKWLRRLAPALNTSAGFILDHDPHELPTDVLEIWADIPEESRTQAIRVLQAFRRSA